MNAPDAAALLNEADAAASLNEAGAAASLNEAGAAASLNEAGAAGPLTLDAYAGGRLQIAQPAAGLRAGDDALLLAAAVPAGAGDLVVEGGTGTGAAALALLARVPAARVAGIEIDAGHAALARANAARNAMADRLQVVECDIAAATRAGLAARGLANAFDHAMANPPFFEAGRVRAPASASRVRAHLAPPGSLAVWIARLGDVLRGGGTLTLIHRPQALGALVDAMARVLGSLVILPLAPRPGGDATRLIVQARKGGRAATRLLAPLVLHGPGGAYSPEAEAVLRGGAALDLGTPRLRIVAAQVAP